MKKFKHRKTGEIATYKDGVLKSSGFAVEIGVEPSKEFWQLVEEKEYEILSFKGLKSSNNKNDYYLNDNGYYQWGHTGSLHKLNILLNLVKSNYVSIKSIKRLSDG